MSRNGEMLSPSDVEAKKPFPPKMELTDEEKVDYILRALVNNGAVYGYEGDAFCTFCHQETHDGHSVMAREPSYECVVVMAMSLYNDPDD